MGETAEEAGMGAKARSEPEELRPEGWAGPWGQLGASKDSGRGDRTIAELQAGRPAWPG